MTERDSLEVDALVTDEYLDSLLAARERRPTPRARPELDPAVAEAADALGAQLVRVHPSFRFEERLAADLQSAARPRRRASRAAPIHRLEPRPPIVASSRTTTGGAQAPVRRPLIIGGALTSAALSLAGAYVAWRRGRPPVDPMVRAVRAAHRGGVTRRIAVRARNG
jgi:hypothetical protein